MRKTTKSVQRPNPKYRTTFDSAMPLSYIASHYLDVRKCKSGISNPRPGLTPGTALRAVGSGITSYDVREVVLAYTGPLGCI